MYLNAKNVALQETAESRFTFYPSQTSRYVYGSSFADTLGGWANSLLFGGLGDDRYALWDASATVTEMVGEGIDTIEVLFWGGYVLPANVENLVLNAGGAYWGKGNAMANILKAGTTGATLDGKGGDDVLVGGSGADVFKIAAGSGSDAIVGFQTNWDVVQLSGYGITSFAQLKAASIQKGADVQVNFANGEILMLRDTRIAALSAADFGFSSIGGIVGPGMQVMNSANGAFNTNGVYALNMAWNPGGLRYGTDYAIESVFSPVDVSRNATFNWTFPTSTDPNFSIKAYPSIMFGVSPYGDTRNTADTAHTFPIRMTDIVAMSASFDTTFSGNKGGFNVAYDIWFTNKPNGGPSSVTDELMIWTHKGSFDAFGTLIGRFDAGGVKGAIYNTGTYTAIITDQDMPKGSIDLAAIFQELQKMGILSANDYVASIQLGSEVSTGVGSLTVKSFALSVETSDGTGGTILKEASGAGTTVTYRSGSALPTPASPTAVDELVAGGAERTTDAAGLVTGVEKTSALSGGRVQTLRYDTSGTLTKSEITDTSNGYKTVAYHDADGRLIAGDMIFVGSGTTVTKHYGSWWNYTGQDVETKAVNGATIVQHYDARGTLVATDSTRTLGTATVVQWWDAQTGTSGATVNKIDANGNGRIETLDGAWKLLAYDEYSMAGGISTVRHYDADEGLLGGDATFVTASGVRVQQVYDKSWTVVDTVFTGTADDDLIRLSGKTAEVHGGWGSDDLWAGSGRDSFHFETAIGTDVDTIHNFAVGKDDIYLAASVFGPLPTSGGSLAPGAFATDTAKNMSTRIVYDSKDGSLYYDPDGTGSKAAVLFAHLDPGLALKAGDFHLI